MTLFEEQKQRILAHPLVGLDDLPDKADADALLSLKNGAFSLKIEGKYLHSRHDPLKEAGRQVSQISRENDEQLLLFFGAGLGYNVQAALAAYPNPIVWFEPRTKTLVAAIQTLDFRENLESGKLIIIPETPSFELLDDLFRGRGNSGIIFVAHRPSFNVSGVYQDLMKLCEDFINKKDVNLRTISRFDRLWARNICANFPHMSSGRPVADLFNRLPEGGATVIGAGPSLSDSLEEIRRLRESTILIAVDTAVKVLTSGGIDPHIIVTVDPQSLNHFFLEAYRGEAILVADPTTTYMTLRNFPPERVFYTGSPFPLASLFFNHLENAPGDIAFGGSVSTNAYDLAIRIGCNRIYLFGHDLSFTDRLAHARGAILEERINLQEKRTFRREMHNYRQLAALPMRYLPGIHGGESPTNDKLVIFHRWFSRRINQDLSANISVFNLTARGALLEGVPHQPPPDYNAHQKENIAARLVPDLKPVPFDPRGFQESLSGVLAELADFEIPLTEGLALAEKILERARSKKIDAKFGKLLRQMDDIDNRVRERLSLSTIIGGAMQKIIFQITEDSGNLLEEDELKDPNLNMAKKSELLYAGLTEACRLHRRWLSKTLAVLSKNS